MMVVIIHLLFYLLGECTIDEDGPLYVPLKVRKQRELELLAAMKEVYLIN